MFCGELSFLHMCALYKWNFTCDVHIGLRPAPVYVLQSVLSQECNVMSMYSSIYIAMPVYLEHIDCLLLKLISKSNVSLIRTNSKLIVLDCDCVHDTVCIVFFFSFAFFFSLPLW